MDAARAISLVVARIRAEGLAYPTEDLRVDRFQGGWCVFAPVMVADGAPEDDVDRPMTRSVFLVGASGHIDVVSSSEPAEDARSHFAEACLWFGAGEPRPDGEDAFSAPSHPDFDRFARPRGPRPTAAHDRLAVEAFARALRHEKDFAGWLTGRLRELGDLLGGTGHLVARRPDAWSSQQFLEFLEQDVAEDEPLDAMWESWPPVDPARLPDVDTSGWLLVPGDAARDYLESLSAGTTAAARLTGLVADRTRRAPAWLACGVAELVPALVAVRRDGRVDADLAELRRLAVEEEEQDFFDMLTGTSWSDDADVEALLRYAIDADRNHRDVVHLDVAATAAYRRFLDRLGLGSPEWFGMAFGDPDPFDVPPERERPAVRPVDPARDGAVVTDERHAIASVVEWIRSRGLDHPTEGLVAERFEAGWSVYAPVEVDESDPMAFLDLPVGRSVFLVGDSGRIKETSSSVPPGQAEEEFIAEERAADGMIDLEWAALRLREEGAIQSFTIVDTPPEEAIAAEASELIEPIVQQLARLGPPGWRRFDAVFAVTVSAEIGRVRFRTDRPNDPAPVPEAIMALVRRQRDIAARMPAGPWWRLLLSVTHQGETAVEYDYGDRPFPREDLLPPEHYRADLAAYPRGEVPAWLADYLADDTPEVLDTKVGLRRLHADAREIAHGDLTIPLDRVDWVRYGSVHTTTKRFLAPSSHHARWHFSVGTYPVGRETAIDVEFPTDGKDAPPPDAWAFLVELSRRHLEPRLVARLADRVRSGETVEVGGVRVHRGGVGPLPWSEVGEVRVAGGQVSIHRAGEARPAVVASWGSPNAVLLPALLAAVAP
ncbi:hypothetical protein ACWEFJ_31850 [Actinosynnema sp. NPDC004786]